MLLVFFKPKDYKPFILIPSFIYVVFQWTNAKNEWFDPQYIEEWDQRPLFCSFNWDLGLKWQSLGIELSPQDSNQNVRLPTILSHFNARYLTLFSHQWKQPNPDKYCHPLPSLPAVSCSACLSFPHLLVFDTVWYCHFLFIVAPLQF